MKRDRDGWLRLCLFGGSVLLFLITLGMPLLDREIPLWWAIWLALLLLGLVLGGTSYSRRNVIEPLEELEDLFDCWPDTRPEELRERAMAIQGAPERAAQAALVRMEEMERKLSLIRETTAAETALATKRDLAEEICRSALPQVLENLPALEYFGIEGLKEGSDISSCTFYDYFFLDAGLLAVVIGEVPGGEVSNALFMVVAQTAIRSRLRLGRSLEETMADVNTQLYDLGAKQTVHALVGLLRASDGRFFYVNAGGCRPLRMKNSDRYEWMEVPVSAPLGLNEKVSYRSMEMRLRQGDRLFFFTEGLSLAADRAGISFGDQELLAVLNRSRSQASDPAGILRFVADEAAVYCARMDDVPGYAAMVLEYRKGNKELAHSEVPALPEYAPAVAQFLKKQFEDNGISPRQYAKVAVVADEMFALCCRRVVKGTTLITECGSAPDGESVTIRMTGAMNGVDPIQNAQGDTEESAVDFIRNQVDYITFKHGQGRDSLMAVCFWE